MHLWWGWGRGLGPVPAEIDLGTVVMAIATVAMAVVAIVQVAREILHTTRRDKANRGRLSGDAWLARRSCEVTIRSAPGIPTPHSVAQNFTRSPAVDRLQSLFRRILGLSHVIGGDTAAHGEAAFGAFLSAADRMNEIMKPSTPANTGLERMRLLCEEALAFLYEAVVELEHLAPRRPREPLLPARNTIHGLWPGFGAPYDPTKGTTSPD